MGVAVFTNNATSSLTAAITAAQTTLTVAEPTLFPSPSAGDWFPLTLVEGSNMEIVRCTARSGATLTVTRAQEGTTAQAFGAGAQADHRLTAAAIVEFLQKGGGTMTGNLTIAAPSGTSSQFNLNSQGAGGFSILSMSSAAESNLIALSKPAAKNSYMELKTAGVTKWQLYFSDFNNDIWFRRMDGATPLGDALKINQTTGVMTLEATPMLPGANPSSVYHATHKAYVDQQDALKLPLTGGTLTGNLAVQSATPVFSLKATVNNAIHVIDKFASGFIAYLEARSNGVARWQIQMGDASPELGTDDGTGSDFTIARYHSGTWQPSPFKINRKTGLVDFACGTTAAPIGSIIYMPCASPPTGYIKANGALLSRTGTYAALWAFAQASGNIVTDAVWGTGGSNMQGGFSTGDGLTTFRIPDMRGEFVRGLDEGRGADTGRVLGSWQVGMFTNHSHPTATTDLSPEHRHATTGSTAYVSGSAMINNAVGGGNAQIDTGPVRYSSVSGAHNHDVSIPTSTSGGTETRPRNNALLACIRYL